MAYDTIDAILGILMAVGLPIAYIVAAVIVHRRAQSTRAWYLYWASSLLAFFILTVLSLRIENWFPPPFDAQLDCDPNQFGSRGDGMGFGAVIGALGCLINGLIGWLVGWGLHLGNRRAGGDHLPRWRQVIVALMVIGATIVAFFMVGQVVDWLATGEDLTVQRTSNRAMCPSQPIARPAPTPSPTPWKWGDPTEDLPVFDPQNATWTQAQAKGAVDQLVTDSLQVATAATDEPPADTTQDPEFADTTKEKSCAGGIQYTRSVRFSATSSQPVEDMFALFKRDGYREYLEPDVYSTLDFTNPIDTIHAGTTGQNIGYLEVTSRCTP